jgi:hypothetical protein
MAKTKDRVSDAAGSVKPYVQRAMHDKELRENVQNAYTAARAVYDEVLGGRGMTALATRFATDKDIHESLRTAIDELRQAADRIQGRQSHTGRNIMLLVTGIALGVLFNPMTGADTRRWLKERLLGGDDQFGYQGNTSGNGG